MNDLRCLFFDSLQNFWGDCVFCVLSVIICAYGFLFELSELKPLTFFFQCSSTVKTLTDAVVCPVEVYLAYKNEPESMFSVWLISSQ